MSHRIDRGWTDQLKLLVLFGLGQWDYPIVLAVFRHEDI